ncbi:HsmA family protein [Granulicoccus sp. GXG6511]|uniref:HsmA family protein n=1 Tax=Granulicoccus sp. GXG6511 TaxID=3381351 RepID=UPI003D7C5D3E
MLISAIVLITAALGFYSAGVWTERAAGSLRAVHAVLFALGLAADGAGTFLMSLLASNEGPQRDGLAGALNAVMAVTGAVALILMALHLLWAVVVLIRNRPQEKATFHRFSVVVWAIWLVPYFTGLAGAVL